MKRTFIIMSLIVFSTVFTCCAGPWYEQLYYVFPCDKSVSQDKQSHGFSALALALVYRRWRFVEVDPQLKTVNARYCFDRSCISLRFEVLLSGTISVFEDKHERIPDAMRGNMAKLVGYVGEAFKEFSCYSDKQLKVEMERLSLPSFN
jgi:hypothetical protein